MKKQMGRDKIQLLTKKLKRQKYTSLLFALFTFGVNIFAWFAFSANAGLGIDATVAAWDVEFKDNGEISRNLFIEVSKMKPGMSDFVRTIEVNNKSDVVAKFSYEFVSVSLLGHVINLSSIDDLEDYLANYYPFSIQFSPSSDEIAANGSITYNVSVTWPYEDTEGTTTYYAQNDIYDYNDTFLYYTKAGDGYVLFDVPSLSIYNLNKSSLYLEKDDADTYFGMACHHYEEESGQPCLTMNLRLIVEQKVNS